MTEKELQSLCQLAARAAKEAGGYIQSKFNKQYLKQQKQGGDSKASQVVTEVDLKAQAIILDHLQPSFIKYNLGLLTEESPDDESRLNKPYFWCIDPMDGTLSFTENRTGYAVSIALINKSGDPVVGVVFVPDQGSCYTAIKGKGVYLNDQRFERKDRSADKLHVYLDQSLQSAKYYDQLTTQLDQWATENKFTQVKYNAGYGAVCNAIAVLNTNRGCYFKLPKPKKGGGSIWDFAATRLFFEELNLPVSNAFGDSLHLNKKNSTFMNEQGVIYATHEQLSEFIISRNDVF